MFSAKVTVIEELVRLHPVLADFSQQRLYTLWREEFWHVFLKSWQPFAKCDDCAKFKLNNFLETSETTVEKELLRAERKMHLARVAVGRSRYMERALLAKTFPDQFLHICIDGMDNKKTNLPHCHASLLTKEVEGAGIELQTKLLGALVDGVAFYTFLTFPTYVHASGLTWTGFLCVLESLRQAGRTIPPYLFLQLDNAGRDNKNQFALAFLGYLVHVGMFKRIYVNFLPVGHTHGEIDQRFSVIAQRIRSKDILTPMGLLGHLEHLFKDGTTLRKDVAIDQVADIATYFEGTYHLFKGLGTFRDNTNTKRRVHSFLIENEHGTQNPVVSFKEHDEAGSWRGDWSTHKAMPIFKNSATLLKDLSSRTLMRTPHARIDIPMVEKKVGVVLEYLKPAQKPTVGGTAIERQKKEYDDASNYWPAFVDKEKKLWGSSEASVTTKPTDAPFTLAPFPTKMCQQQPSAPLAELALQVIMEIFVYV